MAAEAGPEPSDPRRAHVEAGAASGFWARIREHKVIQWGVGYLGAALALAHGAELVSHALHWPDDVWRVLVIALIVGFPIALTVAWYHGHKGFTQMSQGELAIVSVLVLIGAVFFTSMLPPAADHAAGTAADAAESGSGANASPRAASRSEATEPARSAAAVLANSVAVLPCENLSPNPDDAFFASGIHEEILNHLAKIDALTVIARQSMVRYADRKSSIQEIARELGVETVMDCTVRYADRSVRITTQLIDAATEAHLWSERYTRPFENIFAIQTDIATQVAAALEAELAPGEERELGKPQTQSADAYAQYLRAMAVASGGYTAMGAAVSTEQSAEFHRHLDRALELDPEFALGYAAKARDYAYSMGRPKLRSLGLSFDDRGTLALANAQSALSLDPELGLAHAAIATVYRFQGRYRDARLAIEKAVELSPNDYQVLFDAVVIYLLSDSDAGLEYAQRAVRINPVEGFLPLGLALVGDGDYDAAVEQFESAGGREYKTLPIELARVELLRGNRDAVREHLREQERRGILAPATIPNVAYLYRLAGAPADARRVAATLEAFAVDYATGPADWALAALAAGNEAEALRQLELAAKRARGADVQSMRIIAVNYFNDPVLEQPEFVEARSRFDVNQRNAVGR